MVITDDIYIYIYIFFFSSSTAWNFKTDLELCLILYEDSFLHNYSLIETSPSTQFKH